MEQEQQQRLIRLIGDLARAIGSRVILEKSQGADLPGIDFNVGVLESVLGTTKGTGLDLVIAGRPPLRVDLSVDRLILVGNTRQDDTVLFAPGTV